VKLAFPWPHLSSGRHRSGSTHRLDSLPVRCYISRRYQEATADPRHTVALSPPRVALRHFRTRAKNSRTNERRRNRVAIFRHGCTHQPPSPPTSSPSSSSFVADDACESRRQSYLKRRAVVLTLCASVVRRDVENAKQYCRDCKLDIDCAGRRSIIIRAGTRGSEVRAASSFLARRDASLCRFSFADVTRRIYDRRDMNCNENE